MKNLQTANKGLKALAKENPSLVEDKFGYDVPGYKLGGSPSTGGGGLDSIMNFFSSLGMFGGNKEQEKMTRGFDVPMNFDAPKSFDSKDIDFSDVTFNKEAVDEAQEDLDDINFDETDFEDDDGVAIDIKGKTPDQIGEEIANRKTMTDYLNAISSLGSLGTQPGDTPQMMQGTPINMPKFQAPSIGRFREGGIAKLPFDYEGDIREYMRDILGINYEDDGIAEDMVSNIARAYGAESGIGGLGYRDTRPGASISIDAKDVTPDVYRFYPSEVSKIYAQAKGVPFSPLVAPPREATYVDALQPRRIASQLYAKDGTFVDRDELVTGPGGEKGDKIPAMLSDGEFVTNSAAVRGMGIAAGADPNDEYEQRLIGAREMYKMQKFGEEIAKQLV